MIPHSTKADEFNNPDDLYEAFVERLPALPDDATNWPVSLPHLYFEALPIELRESLEADNFTHALRSTLTDKRSQYDALSDVRAAAVTSWTKLSKQTISFQRMMQSAGQRARAFTSSFSSPSNSPARKLQRTADDNRQVSFGQPLAVATYYTPASPRTPDEPASTPTGSTVPAYAYRGSMAEQTERKYRAPLTADPSNFPTNPFTGYRSKYSLGQEVCFYCGPNPNPPHTNFFLLSIQRPRQSSRQRPWHPRCHEHLLQRTTLSR
jgi:hypothetical protein